MSIINKIINLPTASWKDIQKWDFNTLKENSLRSEIVKKLKTVIKKEGFKFAFECSQLKDGIYCHNGMGRFMAIKELEQEGFLIPPLPYSLLECRDLKEAKKNALLASSSYGKITQLSLADFTSGEFDLDELKELQVEQLNLGELNYMLDNALGGDVDVDFDNINSNANRERQEKNQLVTCPHCDGKFNMQI